METTVYLEFRKFLDLLTVSYGPTPIFQQNVQEQRRVQIGNLDNLPSGRYFPPQITQILVISRCCFAGDCLEMN